MGKPSVPPPSVERIQYLLDYDPLSGVFTWKNPSSNRVKRGARAGCLVGMPRGVYRVIGIDGVSYRSSALAILYVPGRFPPLWSIMQTETRSMTGSRICERPTTARMPSTPLRITTIAPD